jgi:hypothetical protein
MPDRTDYAFMVCTVADLGKTAVKTITRGVDGSLTKKDYDLVVRWKFSPTAVESHEAMAAQLRGLALDRRKMVVMGEHVANLDLGKPHLRRWADSAHATLRATPRGWIALDLDDVVVPPGMGKPGRLIDAAVHVRDKLLPTEFVETQMIVTATSQSGLRGDDVGRMRLWFALDRAVPLADLKRWVVGLRKVNDLPVDPSVIQAGQPIYTGRPVFVGMADPISPDMHAVVVPGFCADTVTLDVSAFDAQAAVIDRAIKQATRAAVTYAPHTAVTHVPATVTYPRYVAGGDWRRLLDMTLGVNGFFAPLTQALGLAARTAAMIDILSFAEALLAERADSGRRLQYNAAWIRRTVERFRQADERSQAEIRSLHARIFGGQSNG